VDSWIVLNAKLNATKSQYGELVLHSKGRNT
jgi:hypothetical protein